MVLKIKARAAIIGQHSYTATIRRLPKHQEISCNETAHQAPQDLLCSPILDPDAEQPPHNYEDKKDLDCAEAATIARRERRAVLRNYIPLPAGLSLVMVLRLPRIRTGTVIP